MQVPKADPRIVRRSKPQRTPGTDHGRGLQIIIIIIMIMITMILVIIVIIVIMKIIIIIVMTIISRIMIQT